MVNEKFDVTTPTCIICNKRGSVKLSYEELRTLNNEMSVEPRKNIQDILPNLTRSEREQLITGTHKLCFMEAFGQLHCEHNFVKDTITNTDVRCCEKCELWEDDQLEEEE